MAVPVRQVGSGKGFSRTWLGPTNPGDGALSRHAHNEPVCKWFGALAEQPIESVMAVDKDKLPVPIGPQPKDGPKRRCRELNPVVNGVRGW